MWTANNVILPFRHIERDPSIPLPLEIRKQGSAGMRAESASLSPVCVLDQRAINRVNGNLCCFVHPEQLKLHSSAILGDYDRLHT